MVSWILLWCICFKYLQSIEKKVRLYELIEVLERLFIKNNYNKTNVNFLEYILQTILEYGKLEHMSILFDAINEFKIPSSYRMKQYYFKCLDKEKEMRDAKKLQKRKDKKEERKHTSSMASNKDKDQEKKLIEKIKRYGKLRRRSFKPYKYRRNLLTEEAVSFKIPGTCPDCTKISDISQIFMAIEPTGAFKCFF